MSHGRVSRKDASGVPPPVRRLIGACITDVDALELLLVMVRQPGQDYAPAELTTRTRNMGLTEAMVRTHLRRCIDCGVIAERDGRYRYDPARPETHECMRELLRLYHERPVTLLRAIYAPTEDRIRAFSDAFQITKG